MGRVAAPPAGRYAQLTAEAIGIYAKRAGMNTTQLRTGAGMTYGYYYVRMAGRMPFSLNDIEALCKPLGVAPLDVAQMAAALDLSTGRDSE